MKLLEVYIWDKRVGYLSWDEKNNLSSFRYDKDFLSSGLQIAPLTMPLSNQIFSFPENKTKRLKALPSVFADSLPDAFGDKLIDDYFSAHNLNNILINPLHKLSYIGQRGMGALEYKPQIVGTADKSEIIEIGKLQEMANMVLSSRQNFRDRILNDDRSILDILKIGTSAGGAKPKAIIAYNKDTHEVRSGQVKAPNGFGYYLLKFDGQVSDLNVGNGKDDGSAMLSHGIGNIEYAYYLMATACGINMSECNILQEGGFSHFITKRFDRTDTSEKIHTQTLTGIANLDRDSKISYNELFRVASLLNFSKQEIQQIYTRMVFNLIAHNHDDHAKNHSFLMDKDGKWHLAPAYDICYSYNPNGSFTKEHQMAINGKSSDITYDDLMQVAKLKGIQNADDIITKINATVADWKVFAKEAGVRNDFASEIEKNLLHIEKKPIQKKKKQIRFKL